jgi:hypothetical protein
VVVIAKHGHLECLTVMFGQLEFWTLCIFSNKGLKLSGVRMCFVPTYTKCGKANPQFCPLESVVLKLWHSVFVSVPIDTGIISGFVTGLHRGGG